jgi:hypothetical protein
MNRTLNRTVAVLGVAAAGVATFAVANVQAGHTNSILSTDLSGRAEVGADAPSQAIVGDPNGRGEAYVFGIDGDPTTLCYVLTVGAIDTPTMAHIHEGAAGTNGPVVANLAAPGDGDAADCLTEGEAGKGLTAGQVAEILEHPEGYYVNVHNAAYPGGAIRGQLAPVD